MNIAYINFDKGDSHIVEKRMFALAQGAKNANIKNIVFFYLNSSRDATSSLLELKKFKRRIFPFNYFDYFFYRYKIIEKSIDLQKYDFIILRYPAGDPSGMEFTSRYNVITEHHTKEIQEYLSHLEGKLPFIIKTLKRIRLKLEIRYGHKILGQVKGIICVTDEIRNAELSRIDKKIPSITIPNGIDVQNIKKTGFKRFDGNTLNLVTVVSSPKPWHGLDKIISSINLNKGKVKINFHIVGNITKNDINNMPSDCSKIIFHGLKYGAELDKIMKDMNCAIGAMALYRNEMHEACSLKTREYTARGIPFILAYKDPDLQYVEKDHKFYLPFTNDESEIQIEKIIDFAGRMSEKDYNESISDYMREYALKYMDWTVKIKKYIEFLEEIEAQKSNK
jgi:glycosyltransferase involved in cell wall biosynthesis